MPRGTACAGPGKTSEYHQGGQRRRREYGAAAGRRDRVTTEDFALPANWHLRTAPTQCELSDQEVATPQAPRLTGRIRQCAEPLAVALAGGGKDQGGS